jgi:hypothetical protein
MEIDDSQEEEEEKEEEEKEEEESNIIQLGEVDRILLNDNSMAFSRIIQSLFADEDFIYDAYIGPLSDDID